MKKLLSIFIILATFFSVSAQDRQSLVIDQQSFKPVHTDALTGVAIDKIPLDSSRRPCARIKVHVNRMTKEEIDQIELRIITNNEKIKCKTADYDNGLILELTAKPETRFYFHHDKFGDSNEVLLNLEANTEYLLEAYLNQLYPITVASNVVDASIYIDNEYKGKTNSEFVLTVQDVVPGEHTLRVEYGGSRPERKIDVHAGSVYFRQDVNKQASMPQYVIFKVFPTNAIVEIEGSFLEAAGQDGEYIVMSKSMRQGSYRYTVTAPEHHPQSGTIVVRDQKVIQTINLTPAYGWLDITGANLNGSMVYIDNHLIGAMPIQRQKLESRTHQIKIIKSHYKPYQAEVAITDSQVTTHTPVLEPNFAKVEFVADKDVEIWINDEHIGTGSALKELDNGSYSVEGRKAGHEKSVQVLDITSTASKVFNVKSPTPIYGSINIESSQLFAKVQLDGEDVGETPLTLSNVIVGNHTITITKPHYQPYSTEVTVSKNQTSTVSATLVSDGSDSKSTAVKSAKTPKAPKQPKSPAPKPVKPTTAKPVATKPAAVKPSTTKQPQSSSTGIGYQSNVMLGAQFGLGNEGTSNCGVSYVGGLRAGNFFVGLGVGANVRLGQSVNEVTIDTYEGQRLSSSLITVPAFLNVRIYMSKGGCKPYLSCYGGAAFGQKRGITIYTGDININYIPHNTTEYFAEPGFGLNFKMKGKSSFNIEFGLPITTRHFFEVMSGGQSNSSISVTVPGGNTTTRSSSTSNIAKQGTIYQKGGFALSTRIGFTF